MAGTPTRAAQVRRADGSSAHAFAHVRAPGNAPRVDKRPVVAGTLGLAARIAGRRASTKCEAKRERLAAAPAQTVLGARLRGVAGRRALARPLRARLRAVVKVLVPASPLRTRVGSRLAGRACRVHLKVEGVEDARARRGSSVP